MENKEGQKFQKTFKTISAVGAESKKHIHQIKIHTELLFATSLALILITVIQGMEVWNGDVLPSLSSYYVSKNHPERRPHQGKSFVSVLRDHPQTVVLRLILLFHLTLFVDLFFRWFFLVQTRSISVIRLLKMIFIFSFLLQCAALGLRCYLLLDRLSLWSIFGLLLTLTAIIFTIASFVELSWYFRNVQVLAFFYGEIQKKKFRNDRQIKKTKNFSQTPSSSQNSEDILDMYKLPFEIAINNSAHENYAPNQQTPPVTYNNDNIIQSNNSIVESSVNPNRQIINFSELTSRQNNIQYAREKKAW